MQSDCNTGCNPTLAGWLFRPLPILLTDNLKVSFKHIVSSAAIFDSFPEVIVPVVIAWHVASVDIPWQRAGHHCEGNNVVPSSERLN